MQKKIVLEFIFDEVQEDYGEDTYLELQKIERTQSDLDDDELSGLGEEIAQSDWWQVDNWNRIQRILSGQDQAIDIN